MKNVILIFALLLSISMNSQENKTGISGKNELKVNGLNTILGFPEISYERILNDESGLGFSIGFSADDSIDYKFGVTPYYRFYFGKKRAAGMFLESSVSLFSAESDKNQNENLFGGGFGIGIGGKFLTNNGWIGELIVGAGRNFINDDGLDSAYPRIGISFGKRF
ncbi:hypothetical protein [Kordia sp.]|uniref:hypothetical protein n=1 Tax=Kordia sp. TaxID=1965332 RepID=UPI003D6A15DA